MIAIIPAAGHGTRMHAITRGRPKEMLKVGGKPLMQWNVDEARAAGCKRVIVVNGPGKSDIADYVRDNDLEILQQDQMRGLAHAIAQEVHVKEPMLVLLPDSIFYPQAPTLRMEKAFQKPYSGVIAVQLLMRPDTKSYGIVEMDPDSGDVLRILEKPDPSETPSRLAVAGRYILGGDLLDFLREYVHTNLASHEGEMNLTDVLNAALKQGMRLTVVETNAQEKRFDCGTPEGYRAAMSILGA